MHRRSLHPRPRAAMATGCARAGDLRARAELLFYGLPSRSRFLLCGARRTTPASRRRGRARRYLSYRQRPTPVRAQLPTPHALRARCAGFSSCRASRRCPGDPDPMRKELAGFTEVGSAAVRTRSAIGHRMEAVGPSGIGSSARSAATSLPTPSPTDGQAGGAPRAARLTPRRLSPSSSTRRSCSAIGAPHHRSAAGSRRRRRGVGAPDEGAHVRRAARRGATRPRPRRCADRRLPARRRRRGCDRRRRVSRRPARYRSASLTPSAIRHVRRKIVSPPPDEVDRFLILKLPPLSSASGSSSPALFLGDHRCSRSSW